MRLMRPIKMVGGSVLRVDPAWRLPRCCVSRADCMCGCNTLSIQMQYGMFDVSGGWWNVRDCSLWDAFGLRDVPVLARQMAHDL